MNNSKRLLALAVSAALSAPMVANATNGMNLDGYGPIAAGMGGTSMAYDNGTAAMMNNPATLSLMDEGARLDLAVGVLQPNIRSGMGAPYEWDSSATSFVMPAAGYASKTGKLTWGIGAFAQGGMGTEYDDANASAMRPASPGSAAVLGEGVLDADATPSATAVEVMGWEEFSEVGVMRILVPVSYQVNDKLSVAGSVDYVRASMDIKMAMPFSGMWGMMTGTSDLGSITMSTPMQNTLMTHPDFAGGIAGGYFDFADSNPYTGATQGHGFAGKIGFTYKVNNEITVGATYHSETNLGDLEGDADITMVGNDLTNDTSMTLSGNMTIKDFQWPATWAVGATFTPTDRLMVSVDAKRIKWADVMEDFTMVFEGTGGFNTMDMESVLFQDWDDQTVIQAGAAYQVTDALVLRAGLSRSDNPIPKGPTNYLFPATVKDSTTFGFGYAFTDSDDVNFAVTMVPNETVTGSSGVTISHEQTTWQLMYSKQF